MPRSKADGAAKSVVDVVSRQTGFKPNDLTCPTGMDAEVGLEFDCKFTGPEGKEYTAHMKVTRVDGENIWRAGDSGGAERFTETAYTTPAFRARNSRAELVSARARRTAASLHLTPRYSNRSVGAAQPRAAAAATAGCYIATGGEGIGAPGGGSSGPGGGGGNGASGGGDSSAPGGGNRSPGGGGSGASKAIGTTTPSGGGGNRSPGGGGMTPGGRASEGANLVTTEWRGREKLHHLNAEPILAVAERWINQHDRAPAQMPETYGRAKTSG